MSQRHSQRNKARKAARDLLGQGATMAQLDRLLAWGIVSYRVYDRLINPLLDQPIGKAGKHKIIRSVRVDTLKESA